MRGVLFWLTAPWLASGCDEVLQLSPRVPDVGGDAAFDPEQCPSTYSALLPGQPSRYRLKTTAAPMWSHSDDCDNDRTGGTHLAALDDMNEITAAQGYLDMVAGQPYDRTWVGAVQRSTADTPDDAWITVAGGDLPAYWCPPTEPNDGGSQVENGVEQFALMRFKERCFTDAPGLDQAGALCECDGKPSATDATELIDFYRP